jgi:hypothetical protein
MKKSIIGFIVLALVAIPAFAMAAKAVDIEIGGYTKLEMYWDSTQVGKNLNTPVLRYNAPIPGHTGRFNATAQSSRFNLKIKGPKLWGANTSGYIEVDFDQQGDTNQSASNSYVPRMRHAFFRMNWAQTEILMGQYWGMFCNFYPETVQDGPFQNHGQATQRIAQARVTFTTGPWSFAALVGKPYDPANAADNGTIALASLPGSVNGGLMGQRSEFPQLQFSVNYEKDLWGKAAFYSRPRAFTANVAVALARIRYEGGQLNASRTWGQDNYSGVLPGIQRDNQTITPWVIQASTFIPLIPTHTPNLAGTAAVTVQFYVGHGLSFIGNGRDQNNSYMVLSNINTFFAPGDPRAWEYDRVLRNEYGGFLQAQYYFTNEWFLSYAYGFSKPWGVPQDTNLTAAIFQGNNPNGYTYATNQDQTKMWQEHCLTLFYRPIKAFKFGLAYSYMRTDYFQKTTVGSRIADYGDNHSVRFAGWFFF